MKREIVQPNIIPVGRRLYETSEKWSYLDMSGILAKAPTLIEIEEGFLYDGASVPQVAWTLTGLTPDGLMRFPSLPHDWIYEKKGVINVLVGGRPKTIKVTRKQCDRLFLCMLKEQEAYFKERFEKGVDKEYQGLENWRIKIAYAAVRGGGWLKWKPWE